jgi:hypothetical protein
VHADQFVWDTDACDDPEAFGRALCADQGLPLEFASLIGASIRDQVRRRSRGLAASAWQPQRAQIASRR